MNFERTITRHIRAEVWSPRRERREANGGALLGNCKYCSARALERVQKVRQSQVLEFCRILELEREFVDGQREEKMRQGELQGES